MTTNTCPNCMSRFAGSDKCPTCGASAAAGRPATKPARKGPYWQITVGERLLGIVGFTTLILGVGLGIIGAMAYFVSDERLLLPAGYLIVFGLVVGGTFIAASEAIALLRDIANTARRREAAEKARHE